MSGNAAAAAEASAPEATTAWRHNFDPDRLAQLELRMWQAYYRRQPLVLFRLLVRANREQAGASFYRALISALYLARAAVRFGNSTGSHDMYQADIASAYELLGLERAHAAEVAQRELRWWAVRREIGVAAGSAAGEAITQLYATLYGLPAAAVAQAGALRGQAAEVRDRGAADDPAGPTGPGGHYWPEVARLLRDSYRSLSQAVRR